MIRVITLLALILALLAPIRSPAAEQPDVKRLVQVLVTSQTTDAFLPWQKERPVRKAGYGVVIRDKVILTTETLVRNSTLVEIMLPGSGKKLRARAMISDVKSNLALISLVDESDSLPKTELPLTDKVSIEDKLTVVQMDDTSAIQVCEGSVFQISMSSVSSSSFLLLTYKLLTKPYVNNQGAPAFADDKLAGITVDYHRSEQQAMMIPFPVIARFLEDAKEPPYSGFPSAGFTWAKLVDPAKRKFFGLPKHSEQGIQVLSAIPGTGAADKLQPNDVILAIDESPIDSLGFYKDKDFGRILFPYLINGRHTADDKIKLSLMREKKKIDVEIELKAWNDEQALIPEDPLGTMNDYIVSGGLLIRELSGRYLHAAGGRAGPRLSYLYETQKHAPEKPGDRIVVLAGILPDTVNIGYQHIRNTPVTSINGQKIRNMQDVLKAVDKDSGLHSVGLMSYDVDLRFDPEEVKAANKRLLESYRIPAVDSQKLEKITNSQRRP